MTLLACSAGHSTSTRTTFEPGHHSAWVDLVGVVAQAEDLERAGHQWRRPGPVRRGRCRSGRTCPDGGGLDQTFLAIRRAWRRRHARCPLEEPASACESDLPNPSVPRAVNGIHRATWSGTIFMKSDTAMGIWCSDRRRVTSGTSAPRWDGGGSSAHGQGFLPQGLVGGGGPTGGDAVVLGELDRPVVRWAVPEKRIRTLGSPSSAAAKR